jgi:hypothetical protein
MTPHELCSLTNAIASKLDELDDDPELPVMLAAIGLLASRMLATYADHPVRAAKDWCDHVMTAVRLTAQSEPCKEYRRHARATGQGSKPN